MQTHGRCASQVTHRALGANIVPRVETTALLLVVVVVVVMVVVAVTADEREGTLLCPEWYLFVNVREERLPHDTQLRRNSHAIHY